MSSTAPLIEAPKRSKGPIIAAAVVVIAVIAAVLALQVFKKDDEAIRIGVVGASDKQWTAFKKAAADEDITIELVDFADYTQANPALANDEIDLNQFQHIAFLGQYDVEEKQNLVAIGATAIYPMALFSQNATAVKEFKKGDTIAVPSDGTNQARALNLLQSQGLIKLTDGGTVVSTIADIDTAASTVTVQTADAATLPTLLPDVAGAVINNDFVIKAGLKYADALATDDPQDPSTAPYINVFAARESDKNNATYLKLVTIYQTNKDVQAAVKQVNGTETVIPDISAAELQTALDTVKKDIKAKG